MTTDRSRILYLSRAEVEAVGLAIGEIIAALEEMFREKAAGRVEMPPKPGVHPRPDSFLHAMPAYIPRLESAGIKWVSGYPGNSRRGLPYVNGLLVLNDPETGLPRAVMDCTWITAERTAAATAVAARYLARADAETVGILGCGVQGESNLRALQAVLPIRRVRAFDIDRGAVERFVRETRARSDLEVEAVAEPRDAVAGCDVVVTAGPILKTPHGTIQAGWLEAGSFASLIDFDSYWRRDALAEIDRFCTDDRAQLDFYRSRGWFVHIPPVWAELAELVTGVKTGRESPEQRTASCNLGIALEDMAVAPLVYRRARERGLGTWLPL